MPERPIVFSAPMVCAILAGRKTMTRRLNIKRWMTVLAGTRLWVRETWTHDAPDLERCRARFENVMSGGGVTTYGPYYRATDVVPETLKWRPSIFMPRWACRLTLIVENVRGERLQAMWKRRIF